MKVCFCGAETCVGYLGARPDHSSAPVAASATSASACSTSTTTTDSARSVQERSRRSTISKKQKKASVSKKKVPPSPSTPSTTTTTAASVAATKNGRSEIKSSPPSTTVKTPKVNAATSNARLRCYRWVTPFLIISSLCLVLFTQVWNNSISQFLKLLRWKKIAIGFPYGSECSLLLRSKVWSAASFNIGVAWYDDSNFIVLLRVLGLKGASIEFTELCDQDVRFHQSFPLHAPGTRELLKIHFCPPHITRYTHPSFTCQ